MQKDALENQVPKSDRPRSQCLLLWMRDLEWEPRNDGHDLTDGRRRFDEYSGRRKEDETTQSYCSRTLPGGKKYLETEMRLSFLTE